jgi:hypothetical protein
MSLSTVGCLLLVGVVLSAPRNATPGPDAPDQRCEAASEELFGTVAVRPGPPGAKPHIPEPKKIRHVSPKLPSELPTTCGGTITILEMLVGPSGKVERVWTQRVTCKETEKAAIEAVRQWEYQPLRLGGKPVPFCVTVTSWVESKEPPDGGLGFSDPGLPPSLKRTSTSAFADKGAPS